ncbi:DUF2512 family protein [Salicibibacter halophilus]|uniref:DUF2512 family protein n=1 Tax=Salicibibacter halophilus TaxID=2502791 RepID=A0A514LH20_9BACI|nr:YndM family protein [Salicibibacter halophilus]QDI91144.1 DUF2512 family protein [Salicibibacter halophilus]
MKHVVALIIKFVMISFVLWFIFSLFGGVSFANIMVASVALTGISYLVGDMLVLPRLGNTLATVVDIGLVWIGLWVLGTVLFPFEGLFMLSLLAAFAIATGEAFFHLYLERNVLVDNDSSAGDPSPKNLQTEFGSDVDIKSDAKKANRKKK